MAACAVCPAWTALAGGLVGVLVVALAVLVEGVRRTQAKASDVRKDAGTRTELLQTGHHDFVGAARRLVKGASGQTARNLVRVGERTSALRDTVSRMTPKVRPDLLHPQPRARGANDWELSYKEVQMGRRVAGGSFGEIFKGEWCGMTVAVKVPNRDISDEMLQKFKVEVNLMTSLHHPNIVVCLGACLTPGHMMLVMEYVWRGCLYDFLQTNDAERILTYNMVLKFNIDIARGMRYLHHRANVIQRDLKSRNLLLDESFNVKICDFGLSRLQATDVTMTACGTPYWAAPEVILGEAYDTKADVFSFAIVMWELVTRDEPYDGKPGLDTAVAVAHDGLRPRRPQFCPDAYRELMEECWQHDPQKRPGFPAILERFHEMYRADKAQRSTKSPK